MSGRLDFERGLGGRVRRGVRVRWAVYDRCRKASSLFSRERLKRRAGTARCKPRAEATPLEVVEVQDLVFVADLTHFKKLDLVDAHIISIKQNYILAGTECTPKRDAIIPRGSY